jgi:hypothetical protein
MKNGERGNSGVVEKPIHVALNEVKGLLTLAGSASRRFFAVLRMTERAFFNSPAVPIFSSERT